MQHLIRTDNFTREEINALLSDERCKVLEQVSNGVSMRMAVLKKLITQS